MDTNLIQDHRKIVPIDIFDILFVSVFCIVVSVVFVVLDSRVLHWFILPLNISGIIIGADAIRWARGKLETFDPKGILGVFGLHFFFFAPILVVYYNVDFNLSYSPPDWRPWIGYVAWIHVVSLLLYQFAQSISFKVSKPAKKEWQPHLGKVSVYFPLVILICCVSLAFVMIRMGGIRGIVAFRIHGEGSIAGLGSFRIFTRSFAVIVLMWFSVMRTSSRRASLWIVMSMLLLFCVLQFLTGGFMGRRSTVVYPVIWAMGIIHYRWRNMKAKSLLLGMIPIMLFAYVYGLYKAGGERFLDVLRGQSSLKEVAGATGETMAGVLIGDISRADVQAWMVFRQMTGTGGYDYRHGRTYIDAPFTLAPRWLFPWKGSDSTKVIAGTEYVFGKGFYDPASKHRKSLKVYGLSGEAILNFGVYAIPFAYIIWGGVIGFFRKKWFYLNYYDPRLLLGPFFCILCVLSLISDSDNLFSSIVIHLILPFFVIFFTSNRFSVQSADQFDTDFVDYGYQY